MASIHDPVTNPKHYTTHPSGVECIQITEHMPFCLGNVVNYLFRAGLKEGEPTIQDLRKAAWYLNREIERRIELDVRAEAEEPVDPKRMASLKAPLGVPVEPAGGWQTISLDPEDLEPFRGPYSVVPTEDPRDQQVPPTVGVWRTIPYVRVPERPLLVQTGPLISCRKPVLDEVTYPDVPIRCSDGLVRAYTYFQGEWLVALFEETRCAWREWNRLPAHVAEETLNRLFLGGEELRFAELTLLDPHS